ncbi:MAG: hypothetical protein EOM19_00695 [Candidatus Moranbacteria bacterium]|nr:hypothetical protein [Candidatus Moranbacteria bacterium]
MLKKIGMILICASFISGCGLSEDQKEIGKEETSINSLSGGVIQSLDFGKTYEPFVMASEGKNISKTQVFSLNFPYNSSSFLFLGSQKDGLFVHNMEKKFWEKLVFPPEKIYAIESSYNTTTKEIILYALGSYRESGKIYKSLDGGKEWKEIYAEPSEDTVLLSLAIHPKNPNIIYAGTSSGVLIKSEDGGITWSNKQLIEKPIFSLRIDAVDFETIYLLLYEDDVVVSRDGGETLIEKSNTPIRSREVSNSPLESLGGKKTSSLAIDPRRSGVVYAGTEDGVYRSLDYAMTWNRLKVIESIKDFPVRSIAVSPFSSDEIIFGVAKIIYKTSNGGESWQTYQVEADAIPGHIVFDPMKEGTLYVGLRSF